MLADSQRSNIDDYFELKLSSEEYIKGLKEDIAIIVKDSIHRREQFQQDRKLLEKAYSILKSVDITDDTEVNIYKEIRQYLNRDKNIAEQVEYVIDIYNVGKELFGNKEKKGEQKNDKRI